MIDRDQLTEAVAYMANYVEAIQRDHPRLTLKPFEVIEEALRLLLDFPTDEMVEAAMAVVKNAVFAKSSWRQMTEETLETVRQVMFGEES